MTRQQSSDIYSQSKNSATQDQNNAQQSFANTNNSLSRFNSNLSDYMQKARSTFGQGGEYMKDQNTLANTTAAAGANAIGGDLATHAMRTGENTAGYAGTLAEARRGASRDLTDQMAKADAARLGQLNEAERYGVDASKFPASVQEAMYGHSAGAAASQDDAAQRAAQANQGFGDMLTNDLIGAGGQVGAAFAGKK